MIKYFLWKYVFIFKLFKDRKLKSFGMCVVFFLVKVLVVVVVDIVDVLLDLNEVVVVIVVVVVVVFIVLVKVLI